MKWFHFILIQAIAQLITLVNGVVSSIVASVIFHLHQQSIITAFEAFERDVRRTWVDSVSRLRTLRLKVTDGTRLSVSWWDLSLKALVQSRETVVLAGLGLAAILVLPGLLALQSYFHNDPRFVEATRAEWSYRISEGDTPGDLRLHINRDGVEIFSTNTRYATLVAFNADGTSTEISLDDDSTSAGNFATKDISGDYVPEIVIQEDCGCSGGYTDYQVLSLGTEIREEFSAITRSEWRFEDLDGDKLPEIITDEQIVDDLGSSSALITTVEVILKYDKGRLRLATNLMRSPPPTTQEFSAKIVEDGRKYYSEEAGGPDDAYIARLVFSGNGEVARRYLYSVMANDNERDFYWSNFFGAMMDSDYWQEVAYLNNWALDQYAFKSCPY